MATKLTQTGAQVQADLDAIENLIPEEASVENKLADKNYVNQSVATASAEFKGTYNSVAELQEVDADANDYAFVRSQDGHGNPIYNRYKYVAGTGWLFEYSISNINFTESEWDAIRSGITAEKVGKIDNIPDSFKTINGQSLLGSGDVPLYNDIPDEFNTVIVRDDVVYKAFSGGPSWLGADLTDGQSIHCFVWNGAQDAASVVCLRDKGDQEGQSLDVTMEPYEIVELLAYYDGGYASWEVLSRSNFYRKPSSGIPKSDLASNVRASLDKADAAATASDIETAIAPIRTDVGAVQSAVAGIQEKIPAQATSQNQLADKAFVNSTVQTGTANFRGTWPSVSAIPTNVNYYPEDYVGGRKPTVNDYLVVVEIISSDIQWEANRNYTIGQIVFDDSGDYPTYYHCIQAVASDIIPDEDTEHWKVWFYADNWDGSGMTGTWRFKYTGNWDTNGKLGWQPEYQVNEKPLTAAQLAALNSNITEAKVSKLDALPTNATLQQSIGDLTPLVLTYGTSYGEDTYNALEAIATGTTNRKAFIKQGNNVYPAAVKDYSGSYAAQAVQLNDEDLPGVYGLSCVIAPDGVGGYITDWSRENAEAQKVFVATYNTTTYQEIRAAYEAGKLPIVIRNNNVYVLATGNLAGAAYFTSGTGLEMRRIRCTRTDEWGSDTVSIENRLRKVTGVPTAADLQSTDKYPSMKTAADYIAATAACSTTIRTMVTLTQAEYDALADYDAHTFYIII